MSWDVIVSKDSTLNGGVSLIGGVSRLVGHWLLFDVIWLDASFSVLTTPWAPSFTVVLQMISLPLKSKIVFSNMFKLYIKLCSPVQFDSQVQNQVAYISSCYVHLRNSCLAHSVSSQRWDKIAFKLLKWILLVAGCCRSASERLMKNLAIARIETMMQLYLTQFKTSLSVKSGPVLSETV